MSYLAAKAIPDVDHHNYKANCMSVDRVKYGKEALAKLEQIESKIISMKEAQEDVGEMEADYIAVKAKIGELKFSTHQAWLKLNKAIEQSFREILAKYKARTLEAK